ncbi:flavin monooxygenase-like protein [Dactylonectria estremocensis]|uniref:Flavin monooxygenase-like protein n=1 Tax=Dactylonectria estremocensis TaxID=1079267 RepID=A0A9P9FBH5_9HYPO|nr:flavin monooxygenase-like protein [Dactylonectria estremocensis]
MDKEAPTVAVIGLGVLGLVAVKNLVEEGFNVTGFDRNDYVGGLWHYTDEDKTSVLPTTVINISKERGCFTDFPFPNDTPSHCTSAHVQLYLESYVEHFGLTERLRLGTTINTVKRDDKEDRWMVDVEDTGPEYFDKIVIATGINSRPHLPTLQGIEQFQGEILHSRAFKRPKLFKGKKVVVVGMGNTGADTAAALCGVADKVYISHNHGALIMPRVVNGIAFDHTMTARKAAIMGFLELNFPRFADFLFNTMLKKLQDKAFNIRSEWKLSPAPPVKHAVPIISDNLVDLLEAEQILSVVGIKRVSGPTEVELDDGTLLETDVIIWCTGYKTEFSLLDRSVDPTRHTTPAWASAIGSRGKPLPRLYQNMISLDHPSSMAFMGCVAFATGAFPLYDLASMALAQVWKGKSSLPSLEEMNRSVDRQHEFICSIAKDGSAAPGWVRQAEWVSWANEAAGAGVNEHLGWGLEGWKFWFQDRAFYKLLMDGIYTPFIWRVFAGKRKSWDGARAEIERINVEAAERNKLKKTN